jgi:hypothetical protein
LKSQLGIHRAASIIGAAGPRLSMTAYKAAAEGGREAIIDNAAHAPNLPP